MTVSVDRATASRLGRETARMSATGLQLGAGLPFDAWLGVGRRISQISSASAWWLGDWLVYGEQAYGDRYKLAAHATSLDYQTLRNYAWVARRFGMSRRRDTLSLQHHAEVAALPEPEQDLWLRRAERLGWSRNQLRRNLADARRALGPGDRTVCCRIDVAAGRERRWREAAAVAGQPAGDWIAAALDAAADTVLSTPTMSCSVEASSLQPRPVVR